MADSFDRGGLPPEGQREFWREIWCVVGVGVAFIVVLALVVVATRGIVISVR